MNSDYIAKLYESAFGPLSEADEKTAEDDKYYGIGNDIYIRIEDEEEWRKAKQQGNEVPNLRKFRKENKQYKEIKDQPQQDDSETPTEEPEKPVEPRTPEEPTKTPEVDAEASREAVKSADVSLLQKSRGNEVDGDDVFVNLTGEQRQIILASDPTKDKSFRGWLAKQVQENPDILVDNNEKAIKSLLGRFNGAARNAEKKGDSLNIDDYTFDEVKSVIDKYSGGDKKKKKKKWKDMSPEEQFESKKKKWRTQNKEIFGDRADEELQSVFDMDPTDGKEYDQWLGNQIKSGYITLPGDQEKITDLLKRFEEAKDKPDFKGSKKISDYGSDGELFNALKEYEGGISVAADQIRKYNDAKAKDPNGIEIVEQTEDFTWYKLTGVPAANEMSSGTNWCTAQPGDAYEYINGTGEYDAGPLFICYDNKTGEPVLNVHPESRQTKNIKDEAIGLIDRANDLDQPSWNYRHFAYSKHGEFLEHLKAIQKHANFKLTHDKGEIDIDFVKSNGDAAIEFARKNPDRTDEVIDSILTNPRSILKYSQSDDFFFPKQIEKYGYTMDQIKENLLQDHDSAIEFWADHGHDYVTGEPKQWTELIKSIEEKGDAKAAYKYISMLDEATDFIESVIEPTILKDNNTAIKYATKHKEGRWSELEENILKDKDARNAVEYIKQMNKLAYERGKNTKMKRWKEAEPFIKTNSNAASDYAINVLMEPWKEAEKAIFNGPRPAAKYLVTFGNDNSSLFNKTMEQAGNSLRFANSFFEELKKGVNSEHMVGMNGYVKIAIAQKLGISEKEVTDRFNGVFDNLEQKIKTKDDALKLYTLSGKQRRINKKFENEVLSDFSPEDAYSYAKKILDKTGERIPGAEKVIAKDPYVAYSYALQLFNKTGERVPEMEKAMTKIPEQATTYAMEVLKETGERIPEIEKVIAKESGTALSYASQFFNKTGKRLPEMEKVIAKDPYDAYSYALQFFNKTGERIPEMEKAIAKDPGSTFRYARNVFKKTGERIPEMESTIAKIPDYARQYATIILDTTGERIPEMEKVIFKDPYDTYNYAIEIFKKTGERVPEMEKVIAKDSNIATTYAVDVFDETGERIPEMESAIAKDPGSAFRYARNVFKKTGKRLPEMEKVIAKDSDSAITYAVDVFDETGERIPEMEQIIAKDPYEAYSYAVTVYKETGERIPEMESTIAKIPDYAHQYATIILDTTGERIPEMEKIMADNIDDDGDFKEEHYEYMEKVFDKTGERIPAFEKSINSGFVKDLMSIISYANIFEIDPEEFLSKEKLKEFKKHQAQTQEESNTQMDYYAILYEKVWK